MIKPNNEGWIRHRGGKCPVSFGTVVECRLRNGEIPTRAPSNFWTWEHVACSRDREIMAYRVMQDDIDDAVIDLCVACADEEMPAAKYFDGPLQWRDRIREIDSTVEALEEERVSLVQKLEAEGFRLIDPVKVESRGGMQDWQNWELGDLVEVIDCGRWANPVGAVIEITCLGGDDYPVKAGGIWYRPEMLKWHSRPSA